jgi:tetratricopeptide (TPR) repeat protein
MASRLEGLTPTAARSVMAAGESLDAGRVDEAIRHLSAIGGTDARHPEVLRMQAGILSMRGQHRDALELMGQAIAVRADDPLYHNTLGSLQGQAGDFDSAIASLKRSCELQPTLGMAWYNLGVMLTRSVRNDEAVTALQRAVELEPGNMLARALLADMLRMQGHGEEAAAEYRRVLAERPGAGMAWWGLADLRSSQFGSDDIATMQAELGNRGNSDDDLIAIGFALAAAHHDHGQPAAAMQALAQANALARRRRQWDRQGFSAGVKALNQAFDPAPEGAPGTLGQEVIFIVGLPRSGSTLVEQILASHSQVEGAGELPDLPQVLAEESRRRGQPYPQWVKAMQPADWERLGRRYLERTAHWRRQRPMFTDKLPSNWIYLGAIRAMLPGAHIIGCRRDPLETCFACYRQRLENNEYTRDFDDLAGFWGDYDRSLSHWRQRYPQHVLEFQQEALQADPAQRIRALLSFCDLPFEEACEHFHETEREVRSPSASQVRQPLRRDTSHTAAYGELLDPLRKALGLPPWKASIH